VRRPTPSGLPSPIAVKTTLVANSRVSVIPMNLTMESPLFSRFCTRSSESMRSRPTRAVAAYAAGGAKALEGRKDGASVKLLTQMNKGG
jgi:hypothetical protein